MKKVLFLLLAVILVVPCVYAAAPATLNALGNAGTDVTVGNINSTVNYDVEIMWGDLVFDYNLQSGDTYAWEADNGNWVDVSNHSNGAINASISWTASITDVTATFKARVPVSPLTYLYYPVNLSSEPDDWGEVGKWNTRTGTEGNWTYTPVEGAFVAGEYCGRNVETEEIVNSLTTLAAQVGETTETVSWMVYLSGGSLEDVRAAKEDTAKIGTITVTIAEPVNP